MNPFEVMVLLLVMKLEMMVTKMMVKAEMMNDKVKSMDGIARQIVLQRMSVTPNLWMEFI